MKTTQIPKAYRWTVNDYYEMYEAGMFEGKRMELIDGQIIEIPTPSRLGATAITLTTDTLREVFKEGFFIMSRCPLRLSEHSELEPHIAVIAGNPRDYKDAHPHMAALVVEVAQDDSTYCHQEKMSVYAKAGIADYWIINLFERQLEVYRQPKRVFPTPFDYEFPEVITLTELESIKPLAANLAVAVANLLP